MSETYGYDRIGNLTTKNGQALSYANPAHKHAVSGFGGTSYGYDANGDMVSRGSQSIGYDPERRPVKVAVAGVTQWRTSFGADGKRRKRLDGAGTIHYVGPYERKVGAPDGTEAVTKHYYALGKLLAVRKNGTLSYLGSDQLGSPIRVADASFSPVDRMRYTPFGNSRDTGTNLPTDRRFTGQTQDASVGLYWYGSRAYDPAMGRFTSPDTVVPTILNPQGLNRYSYVTNNPTKYSDPSGHQAADGQTLDSQSPEVQSMFGGTYGDAAAAQWESEHNAEIGASAAPSPVDPAAVAAVEPPPPPVETPAPPEPAPAAAPVVDPYGAVMSAAPPTPITPSAVAAPTPSATPDAAPPTATPAAAPAATPSAVPAPTPTATGTPTPTTQVATPDYWIGPQSGATSNEPGGVPPDAVGFAQGRSLDALTSGAQAVAGELDPASAASRALQSVAKAAPVVGAVIQLYQDSTREDLTPEDRIVRAGIAVGVAVIAGIVTAPVTGSAAAVIGAALIAGYVGDRIKDDVLFPMFGW